MRKLSKSKSLLGFAASVLLIGGLAVISAHCGSTPCGASNCATGCCDSSGTCQNGTGNAACGKGGAACVGCASSQTCTNNACIGSGADGGQNTDAGA